MVTAKEQEKAKLREALGTARKHYEAGQFEKAEPVYRRALLFFDEGEELRQCLESLASMYSAWKNYTNALEMFVRLLALNENELGKSDKRTVAVMREMAGVYIKQGQPQKAEKIQQKASAIEHARDNPPTAGSQQSGLLSTSPLESGEQTAEELEPKKLGMRDQLNKSVEKARPLISGVIVDFSNKRVKFVAKSMVVFVVLLVVNFIIQLLPRNPRPLDVFLSIPHGYRTADGKIEFDLVDESRCNFNLRAKATENSTLVGAPLPAPAAAPTAGDKPAEAGDAAEILTLPYYQFLSDWRDFVALDLDALKEKQYWIFRGTDTVLDEDGRIYYALRGPESQVLDEMLIIEGAVKAFFQEKGRYPKKLSERLVASYKNPFTGVLERPNHQMVTIGDRTSTTARSISERATFYTSLRNGASWTDEPPLKPGSINCCSVTMVSEAGEFYDFIIRGADRDGKTLVSSIPGTPYLVSLQKPKELRLPHPNMPFAGRMLFRPRCAWLISPAWTAKQLISVRHAPSWAFAAFALVFLVVWLQRFLNAGWKKKNIKYLLYAVFWLLVVGVYELTWICP